MDKNIEIIIPVYNEEGTIAEIISGIRSSVGQDVGICVVDDCSTDNTGQIIKDAQVEVVRHPYRMGNGAAIKSGLRRSKADIVVMMDADGQHRPQDIPKLVSLIGEFDMVIGARDFSAFTLRNFANRFYSAFASYVTGFRIEDLTSGFRVIHRGCFNKFIYLLPNGFSYATTLTLSLLKTGRTIKYVGIGSSSRKAGSSKINMYKDGINFLLIITRIATFFSPLKVFLPISTAILLTGCGYYLYTFISYRRFTNMSALLFTTSIIVFMLGLVSEQIAQLRMDRTEEG